MRCCDEGRLRAYLDNEVSAEERSTLADHIDACAGCARTLGTMRADALAVAASLSRWLPTPAPADALPAERRASAALSRFQATVRDEASDVEIAPKGLWAVLKEQMTEMFRRLTAPRLRPALAALSIVAVLAVALAFTPLNSLADQLFKTFRVQQFAAVAVRVPGMAQVPQPQQISPDQQQQIGQMLAALGTPTTNATKATVAEVPNSDAAWDFLRNPYGATLQVPSKLPASYANTAPRYVTILPTSSSYALNVPVAKQYIALANLPQLNSLQWPAGVDTLTFGLDTPATVVTFYGDGQTNGFGIVQMANLPDAGPGAGPALKLPDELDINAFRTAILALPGLPQDTVKQLQNVTDWEHTLIIPVPEDATTKNVTIGGSLGGNFGGNPGLLILDGQGRGSLLLWQDDGIMYAVGGTISEADVLLVANNLTNAR